MQERRRHPISKVLGTGNLVSYHREVAFMLGSSHAAQLLEHIMWLSDLASDPDGFVYKTRDEWMYEVVLTEHEFKNARGLLEKRGLLETKQMRVRRGESFVNLPAYRIDEFKLWDLMEDHVPERYKKQKIMNRKHGKPARPGDGHRLETATVTDSRVGDGHQPGPVTVTDSLYTDLTDRINNTELKDFAEQAPQQRKDQGEPRGKFWEALEKAKTGKPSSLCAESSQDQQKPETTQAGESELETPNTRKKSRKSNAKDGGVTTGATTDSEKSRPRERKPDPMFDAIVKICGYDPADVSGSAVGKAKKDLLGLQNPATPEEVLLFGEWIKKDPYHRQHGLKAHQIILKWADFRKDQRKRTPVSPEAKPTGKPPTSLPWQVRHLQKHPGPGAKVLINLLANHTVSEVLEMYREIHELPEMQEKYREYEKFYGGNE